MGLYNTLHFDWTNPASGKSYQVHVQFKLGEVWTYDYRIGDTLRRGGTELDAGPQGAQHVVAYGVKADPGNEVDVPEHFQIHVQNDIIRNVVPLTNVLDAAMARGEDFVVLDP